MKRPNIYPSKINLFRVCFLLFLIIQIIPATPETNNTSEIKFEGWKQAETKHYRFIFEEASRISVEGFAKYADDAWASIAEAYCIPQDKTDVIVTARTNTINAYAESITYRMSFYTNPPINPYFGYRENWQKLFFTHEMIHIANMNFENKQNTLSNIFGSLWNYLDFSALPGWELEGLTTVLETELTAGGRGRSPFFELFYKAPTVENAFLSFNEIGTESRPPYGQIYVMGYLIMRNIADRWGLDALADIERNRKNNFSLAESVELVTGETPDVIFSEARAALAKKYQNERSIPEGKTITPHSENDFYYTPALIKDDGSMITLRQTLDKDTSAVVYNPATSEEKILFSNWFSSEDALTASADGKIVASLQTNYYDRNPTFQTSYDLYKWTDEKGIKRLTFESSFFEPVLSRDGSRLVAVELSGNTYRLVQIDYETGNKTVLLESPEESYIQPSLSTDGSKIAFLSLDGTRAKLCTAEFNDSNQLNKITTVANSSGTIIDIAYPHWNKNDVLTYASNERGRLEVWEIYNTNEATETTAAENLLADNKLNIGKRPVVSDPVGAFWAEQTEYGVYYASYASSGNVVKIKPSDSWGMTPDFNGPSSPGSIVKLGNLVDDYPDYNPFEKAANTSSGEISENKKREIEKRSDESRKIAENEKAALKENSASAILSNEKRFINTPTLMFWLPIISGFSYTDTSNKTQTNFGAGLAGAWNGFPLQGGADSYLIAGDFEYYPQITQITGSLFSQFSLGKANIITSLGHTITANAENKGMSDSIYTLLSSAFPIIDNEKYNKWTSLSFIIGAQYQNSRTSSSCFSINSDLPFTTTIAARTGLDYAVQHTIEAPFSIKMDGYANILTAFYPTLTDWNNRVFAGAEYNLNASAGVDTIVFSFDIKGRYIDLPKEAPVPSTLVTLRKGSLSTLYPGRILFEGDIVFPGTLNYSIFLEKLLSFGTNTCGMNTPDNHNPMNAVFDSAWYTGIEVETSLGSKSFLSVGISYTLKDLSIFNVNDVSFYLRIKMDGIHEVFN